MFALSFIKFEFPCGFVTRLTSLTFIASVLKIYIGAVLSGWEMSLHKAPYNENNAFIWPLIHMQRNARQFSVIWTATDDVAPTWFQNEQDAWHCTVCRIGILHIVHLFIVMGHCLLAGFGQEENNSSRRRRRPKKMLRQLKTWLAHREKAGPLESKWAIPKSDLPLLSHLCVLSHK